MTAVIWLQREQEYRGRAGSAQRVAGVGNRGGMGRWEDGNGRGTETDTELPADMWRMQKRRGKQERKAAGFCLGHEHEVRT